mgnify:CR=1 FL=1
MFVLARRISTSVQAHREHAGETCCRNSASRRRDAPDVTEYARRARFSTRTYSRSFSFHPPLFTPFYPPPVFFLPFIFSLFLSLFFLMLVNSISLRLSLASGRASEWNWCIWSRRDTPFPEELSWLASDFQSGRGLLYVRRKKYLLT